MRQMRIVYYDYEEGGSYFLSTGTGAGGFKGKRKSRGSFGI